MSDEVIISQLFFEIFDEQQEFLIGGADYKLSNTNYAEKVVVSLDSTASSFVGNNKFSFGFDKSINTAAQDFLVFGGAVPENIPTLPPPPVF